MESFTAFKKMRTVDTLSKKVIKIEPSGQDSRENMLVLIKNVE